MLILIIFLFLVPSANAQRARDVMDPRFPERNEHVVLELDFDFSWSDAVVQLEAPDDANQRQQTKESITVARKTYESAVEKQGATSVEAALRAYDYGHLLSQVGLDEEARVVLSQAIAVFQENSTEHKVSLAKAYLGVAQVAYQDEQSESVEKALDLFESSQKVTALELSNYRMQAAKILVEFSENREHAESLLQLLIPVYEKHYGVNSKQMIPVLITLAESQRRKNVFNEAWQQTKNYNKAVKIAKQQEDPIVYADTLLAVGSSLLYRSKSTRGGKFTRKALAIFEQELGDQHFKTGAALHNMGYYHFMRGRVKPANEYFMRALEVFRTDKNFRNYQLNTLAHIVKNFERAKQSNLSTPYCREIGKMSPWVSDQTPRILYSDPLIYWRFYATGVVEIDFSIDPDGFVTNAKVVHSTARNRTNRLALKAVNSSRYSPKFENGEAVSSHDHTWHFEFGRKPTAVLSNR